MPDQLVQHEVTEQAFRRAPVSTTYVLDMLEEQHQRIVAGKLPMTPSTWLGGHIGGRARDFQGRYLDRMGAILDDFWLTGLVNQVRSIGGSTAWIWTSDLDAYEALRQAKNA